LSTLADVSASLGLLRVRAASDAAVAALAACAAGVAPVDDAFDALDELPDVLRRLAWTRTFGGAARVRADKLWLVDAAWHSGVNRTAGGMADPSGAAALLVHVAGRPAREWATLVAGLHEHLAFEALYAHDASAGTLAVDATILALRAGAQCAALEQALADAGAAARPEQVVCALARWLHALSAPSVTGLTGATLAPPTHDATRELLTARWARGLRRGRVRALGALMGAAEVIEVPAVLISPAADVQALLAPLVVEWLVGVLAALDPLGDAAARRALLEARAPGTAARLYALVPADSASGGALRVLLDRPHEHQE